MEMDFKRSWNLAWQQKTFKQLFITGSILFIALLLVFPFFFNAIEDRNGIVLHDALLAIIPPYNLSIPIFIIIWLMAFLTIFRCIQEPKLFILFLWSFVLLNLARIVTISAFPLNPPIGIIELKDPISNTFYGMRFITKDLFFSGHTATQIIMFFCLQRKGDKILALVTSIAIASMVLVQHVHYTYDVLGAILLSFPIFWMAKRITKKAVY